MGGGGERERERDRGGEREREGREGEREISTPSDCQSKQLQDAHASSSVFAGECSSIPRKHIRDERSRITDR